MQTSIGSNLKQKTRDPYIDILKGIGIMSIVIGHSAPIIIPQINFNSAVFVYGYHMMIFMFILGFLFKHDKDGAPYQYIGKTIFNMGKLYIAYAAVFLLLHNTLSEWGFIKSGEFTFDTLATKFLNSLVFNCEESMLGALWFVPMYVFAAIIFASLFYAAERTKLPILFHLIFIAATMAVGVMMHYGNPWFLYHIQTSVLAIPICYLGFFAKKYWETVKKFVTWYGAVIAAIALNILLNTEHGGIELAANQIITPYLFYPVTVIGIYYCLGLAKIISRIRYAKSLFAYVGKNSFHIMALHFVCLKLADVVYGLISATSIENYSKFPYAFDFWYIYYPLGIFLPLGIIALCKAIKKYACLGAKRIVCKSGKTPVDEDLTAQDFLNTNS